MVNYRYKPYSKAGRYAYAARAAYKIGKSYLRSVGSKRLAAAAAAGAIAAKRRKYTKTKSKKRKRRNYKSLRANSSGTTVTTTRLLIRKTPKQQRFIRRLFKDSPTAVKHINRFGFSWIGATQASKTIWYSICHLKFNNVLGYMQERIIDPAQPVGGVSDTAGQRQLIGNNPSTSIYIGKCTFTYEIYNPTNYTITVYAYDLVCRKDTPYDIKYNKAQGAENSAPETCMYYGSQSWAADDNTWVIGDPTHEESGTYWNTVGIKPTEYHSFNTLWKVKGVKKIILPPAATHHHNVIYNPKKLITYGNLMYPRLNYSGTEKNGIGGLTQATLFGFEGQVAIENTKQPSDMIDSTKVGTLPGKIVVKCVKKINVYNIPLKAELIYADNDLKTSFNEPRIFSDLMEEAAEVI